MGILIENRQDKFSAFSVYARPTQTMDVILGELKIGLDKATGKLLLGGEFNAHATSWGSSQNFLYLSVRAFLICFI